MRKLFTKTAFILSFALYLFPSSVNSQVIFQETFDGYGGDVSGGPGTYTFAPGWTLFNVDNLTPNASVSYVTDAWIRREDFVNAPSDSCAISTSWYDPVAAADDWMWTPAITAPTNGVLTWRAFAPDASYPDGYEVRILAGTAPTVGNLMTSTVLLTVPAEAQAWTNHSVNIASYATQTIYIGFRNNSNDEFLLFVDDVTVENLVAIDGRMETVDWLSDYTIVPTTQTSALNFSGTIYNNGLTALTGVYAEVNVYDSGGLVYTANSNTTASLASAATANFTATGYTPPGPDLYIVEYIAKNGAADLNPINDTLYQSFLVDDSVYARDDGFATGSLGIGDGGGGILGQMFEVSTADVLSSVTFLIVNGNHSMDNRDVYAEVWGWDTGSNMPTTLMATTNTFTCDTSTNQVITLVPNVGPIAVPVGAFYVGVVELDSNVTIGTTPNNFITNVTSVDFPYGSGNWAPNESFGASFERVYVIRPNLGPGVASAAKPSVGRLDVYPNPNNGKFNIHMENVLGGTYSVDVIDVAGRVVYNESLMGGGTMDRTIDLSGISAGSYFVKISGNGSPLFRKISIVK